MKRYYDIRPVLDQDCQYSIIIGRRSNGKSFAALRYGLEQYVKTGSQFAYVRRWDEDFTKQRASSMFSGLVCDGNGDNQIALLTNGEWNTVYYYSRRWYLARWDDETREMKKDEPMTMVSVTKASRVRQILMWSRPLKPLAVRCLHTMGRFAMPAFPSAVVV